MKNETNFAPIVLFVYNRPLHTEKVLNALANCECAKESDLYIYADGPKNNTSIEMLNRIEETRRIIKLEKWCRNVVIFESDINKGLANSVISGVGEVINKYGKIIVLEDDILPGTYFLTYMNEALNLYANENIVKQISGFNFELQIPKKNSSYFVSLASTWGWGTWKRAWDEIEFYPNDYKILCTDTNIRKKFNLDNNYDYTSMLLSQMESNKISSWGIRFWWSVFKLKGLVLYPDYSVTQNIGFDNSGEHCGVDENILINNWDINYKINEFPSVITSDELIKEILYHKISGKTKKGFFNRIVSKIQTLFNV